MITRIILQKQKYDIQIFPKYSWMTVLFEKILIVKDIMKYFLSKWFSLKRAFGRYFYLLRTLTFMIPYWTYWSLVILLTGHMRTRSYENTPFGVPQITLKGSRDQNLKGGKVGLILLSLTYDDFWDLTVTVIHIMINFNFLNLFIYILG